MLKLIDVSVVIDGRKIVDGVSLDLREGQWLMLVGPNGAGKSTLVNAVAQGLSYTGRVLLGGTDVKTIKSAQLARRVGVLSQMNSVNYAFTVGEVVAMGRYAHSRGYLSRADENGGEVVKRALEMTGLTALKNQSMLTLSGGEAQRAFLAQVFAQEPEILILDEPANHLDLVYQKQLFSLIGEWLKIPGRAVVSVVHDLSLARMYGTHAALMTGGRVMATGDIDSVLTRENLMQVYGMDVYDWMRGLFGKWVD